MLSAQFSKRMTCGQTPHILITTISFHLRNTQSFTVLSHVKMIFRVGFLTFALIVSGVISSEENGTA